MPRRQSDACLAHDIAAGMERELELELELELQRPLLSSKEQAKSEYHTRAIT